MRCTVLGAKCHYLELQVSIARDDWLTRAAGEMPPQGGAVSRASGAADRPCPEGADRKQLTF